MLLWRRPRFYRLLCNTDLRSKFYNHKHRSFLTLNTNAYSRQPPSTNKSKMSTSAKHPIVQKYRGPDNLVGKAYKDLTPGQRHILTLWRLGHNRCQSCGRNGDHRHHTQCNGHYISDVVHMRSQRGQCLSCGSHTHTQYSEEGCIVEKDLKRKWALERGATKRPIDLSVSRI